VTEGAQGIGAEAEGAAQVGRRRYGVGAGVPEGASRQRRLRRVWPGLTWVGHPMGGGGTGSRACKHSMRRPPLWQWRVALYGAVYPRSSFSLKKKARRTAGQRGRDTGLRDEMEALTRISEDARGGEELRAEVKAARHSMAKEGRCAVVSPARDHRGGVAAARRQRVRVGGGGARRHHFLFHPCRTAAPAPVWWPQRATPGPRETAAE
jgi:hypothetical protein